MQKKTLIKNIIRTLLEQPLRDMKLQKKKKRNAKKGICKL